MKKAWLTIGTCALYGIGLGQSTSTDSSTLPEFSIYHSVLDWVNSADVNATEQTIAYHFPGQVLPSIVYAEQQDSFIHVVHQQAPFEFSTEVLPALPALNYTAMRTRPDDAGHEIWYLMASEPSRILRKEGLLSDAPVEFLVESDAAWVNFEVIDINGDGTDELVTVEYGNHAKVIAWSDLNGTFVAQDTIGLAAYATHLHAHDLNYDAVPDLIVPGSPLRVFTSANGSWELTASAPGRGNVDFADLDSDHDLDLATTDYYGLTWSQIRNELNGHFDITSAIADTTSDQWYGQACRIADVTGDGAPDILHTRAIDNIIYLWRNGLDEMNELVELTPAGQAGNRHISLVDMDLDGDLDWLGAGPYQHIGILENTQIKFGCTYPFATNYASLANADDGSCTFDTNSCSNCPADLDGDFEIGTPDLLLMLTSFGQPCPEPESPEWVCGDLVNYHGYDYATVEIGDQCWFAENLRSDNYENGDPISADLTNAEWEVATVGAVAIFGEGSGNCFEQSVEGDACDEFWSLQEYGRLYNWFAVDDSRGLCPSGWVVPSDEDWTTMTDQLGGMLTAGDAIKTVSGWPEVSTGTDLSGFSGLPGGYRYWDGTFDNAGGYGSWWSSTPAGSSAWFRYVLGWSSEIMGPAWDKRYGYSVRCIKNLE
ncbi:MAG: FISUMP domain-containing protein [Flavobacteriales bacterium]